MTKHVDLGEMVITALAGAFELVKNDIGSDAKIGMKVLSIMRSHCFMKSGMMHHQNY